MSFYYRYVATNKPEDLPSWSNVWPGQSPCTGRTLSLTATTLTRPPDPGIPIEYNQNAVFTSYRTPRVSGRGGSKLPYRFTNYSVRSYKRREHLVVTHWGCTAVNVFKQYGSVIYTGECMPTESRRESTGPMYYTYDEYQRPYDFVTYPIYQRTEINSGSVNAMLDELRNELVAEASSAYDVLTDIAELGDVPRTISLISGDLMKILRGLKGRFPKSILRRGFSIPPIQLLKHPERLLRKLGDEWMNYRYGVMPLVYSIRDIMKTMNRGRVIKTRKHQQIKPYNTGNALPPDTSTYRVSDVLGSIDIRGEILQFFSSSEIARLSGISFNPLVTAWELIPYSFVFDWFVNVGNYITAAASQTWAQEKYACLSRRDNYSTRLSVHLPKRDKTVTVSNKLPTNWWGAAPPATPSVIISNPAGDQLLQEETIDSYSRWVITVSPVTPRFNPSLNWRRLIDGAVMSLNQLGSHLRHL